MNQIRLVAYFQLLTGLGAIAAAVAFPTAASFALSNVMLLALILLNSIQRRSSPVPLLMLVGIQWPIAFSIAYIGTIIQEAPTFRGELYSKHGPVVFFAIVAVTTALSSLVSGTVGFTTGIIISEFGQKFGLWSVAEKSS